MKIRTIALYPVLCLLFCSITVYSHGAEDAGPGTRNSKKLRVIFDTDMGPDYDDVGAIAMLHAFADSGYVTILGTIASTKYEGVASVLNVFNTYFNRPGIPVGVPGQWAYADKDPQHWTDSLIARYPHTIKNNAQVPDAVSLYRKILAGQPDNSVTIITVGFFTNLNNLVHSGPDQYSRLNGLELVKKKVKNLVSMAGKFPEGKEFNVYKDAAAAYDLFKVWPKPVLFTGWEIGQQIRTGLKLINDASIRNSPVKDAYRISIPQAASDHNGRMSWDQTAVLIAVKGCHNFFGIQKGAIEVAKDGSNKWIRKPDGPAAYVTPKMPYEQLAAYIERWMMHQPM
ncbi:nucleoside hydrolase [Niabella drilacis]|uniref:Inosine-uridine nucleoside N-ribohydrolase n=1 Tax=Niabella drilacis (strain DSM 25811 / CCM 8410 / CCUG 62505 / LMG 26954 / E90) TaxID=1285928 RepID=A0A1G6ZKC8_NIADE|nr:nucleoside hydrolase [Niabella drilacis]SDE02961.1 Inosine-uridine nucleoside N-ribohydrolase [Niabella drilacis]